MVIRCSVIGCIIGAGIYVMTGNAAANFAGPAVILSFIIAFLACVFAGLCYAELASTMPVAGSAYTYSYTSLGEVFAWIMGWLLVLEYGVAAATVAAGWSGNVVSLLANFNIVIPPELTTSFIQAKTGSDGLLTFVTSGGANVLGAAGILMVTLLLVVGISESASVNNVIVFIKVGVLLLFIGFGLGFIFGPNRPDAAKNSPYECGFEAFEDARMKFDVRYYLVAILFILFDLEIAFLFPWAVALKEVGLAGFVAVLIFLAILVVGFVYEWKKGALDWE